MDNTETTNQIYQAMISKILEEKSLEELLKSETKRSQIHYNEHSVTPSDLYTFFHKNHPLKHQDFFEFEKIMMKNFYIYGSFDIELRIRKILENPESTQDEKQEAIKIITNFMHRYARHYTVAYLTTDSIHKILKTHAKEQYENLINNGSDWLEYDTTHYKDSNIIFVANDVTARINITFLKDNKEAYLKAISLLNNILELGFPIEFGIKVKGITLKAETVGLKNKRTFDYDASTLFINASLHPETHEAIKKYISLNYKHGKYQLDQYEQEHPDLEIGAIELHALIAQDLKYFELAENLYYNIDTNLSELYIGLTYTIFKNHGVNELTVAMYDNIAARIENEVVHTEDGEVVIREIHCDMNYINLPREIEEKCEELRTYENGLEHEVIIITNYIINKALRERSLNPPKPKKKAPWYLAPKRFLN